MNILIVEDDKVLSLMLHRMIERLGHAIAGSTATGKEAIEFAVTLDCDLILMDIMLEDEIDGILAYSEIRKRNKNIPVIYITGNSDPVNKERAIKEGYHDYIIKPVIFDDLKRSIDELDQ
ncbi:MAG: response regulator [Balneolaceae bacterium]